VQHAATHYKTVQHRLMMWDCSPGDSATRCDTLQHAVTRCNADLQYGIARQKTPRLMMWDCTLGAQGVARPLCMGARKYTTYIYMLLSCIFTCKSICIYTCTYTYPHPLNIYIPTPHIHTHTPYTYPHPHPLNIYTPTPHIHTHTL